MADDAAPASASSDGVVLGETADLFGPAADALDGVALSSKGLARRSTVGEVPAKVLATGVVTAVSVGETAEDVPVPRKLAAALDRPSRC